MRRSLVVEAFPRAIASRDPAQGWSITSIAAASIAPLAIRPSSENMAFRSR